ncbi:MAG TPA: fumarylacetoacetate hydrolase family protein, partial [Steroidobacter sp.]|nr:fumarylacetoacetate hydrolase family protein [Steroidobacter sp.]
PLVQGAPRFGPCVARPGKFVCIGLNYADHAAETGAAIPTEPVIFMKATSALSGPNDAVIQPRNSTKLDWEVELAFVIGTECRYVDEAAGAAAIAGYFVCNDVSERNFQLERGGQWDKGKGCDSFGPIGPWLVTADEVGDVSNLAMWLEVNGRRYQDGSTRTMIFKPAFLVSYLSQFMSLQPGDIITTGTPPGVGLGQKPPVYLNVGDEMRLGIQGLGEQRQKVVAYG